MIKPAVQIGRYRILGELGRGAMGIVYRAQDPAIGRVIAIKSIRLSEMTDQAERARLHERLFREAQSAGILSHPNIVTIYDISEQNGLAYIFMEFVDGPPLDDWLHSATPPAPDQLLHILLQTGEALDYAHKRGIIHRDIKPANIMVHEGTTAKVCDFGVAKIASQQLTQTGLLLGTPSYMSPEQLQGEALDGRSDQFALGVMVYELLAGKKPFLGDSIPALIFRICRDDPPAIVDVNPTVGPLVDTVIRKALAKKPADRYESCAKFILFVKKALEGKEWVVPIAARAGHDDSTTASGDTSMGGADSTGSSTTSSGSSGIVSGAYESGEFSQTSGEIPAPALPAALPATPTPVIAPAFSAEPFRPESLSGGAPPDSNQKPSSAPPSPALLPALPARELPVRRLDESHPRKSRSWLAVPLVALLAAGGYFAWDRFGNSQPGVTSPTEPPAEPPKPADAPKPNEPKTQPTAEPKAEPKQEPPSEPVAQPPVADAKPAEQPKPNETKPTEPKTEPPPNEPKPGETIPTPGSGVPTQFVTTPPGAYVVVDNETEHSCKTPCTLTIARGRHALLASLDGYVTATRIFYVPDAAGISVALEQDGGTVNIVSTPPGASISINGQPQGKVTPASIFLRVGTYQIEVTREGRTQAASVSVKRNSNQTLRVEYQ